MSEATKKNYIKVGKGVEKFDGGLIEISVCLSEIPQEHTLLIPYCLDCELVWLSPPISHTQTH